MADVPQLNAQKCQALFEAAHPTLDAKKGKKGGYANDRVEGKFQGFYAALNAIYRSDIKLTDLDQAV
jgi:hypothetical protein